MIYLVEDDAAVRRMMLYALDASGLEAEGFADGASFFAALKKKAPQLVMLDIMLPGEDGISILKRLKARAETADIPVIMATAKGTEFDRVTGLDLGADDYLSKPFGMREMISRVRAVLRRCGKGAAQALRTGNITLEKSSHSVFSGEDRLSLTLKEFELLQLLMENPGRVFTREELLRQIWDTDYLGETRTIDVHVGTLRAKLGESGAMIRTVRGVGYRMEASE